MRSDKHRLVFVGGLHRSGTTAIARCLATHPQISGFSDTGAKEDEGQHLQTVYPTARYHGGPGRFALTPAAHLTEESVLATADNAERLFDQWSPHWDLTRPVLLEKSPPNLVMTRFLQALFPDARFLIVVRHPVVVSLANQKRTGDSWDILLANWFRAHDLFAADAPALDKVQVIKYEHLVSDVDGTLAGIATFLGLDGAISSDTIQPHRSAAYEEQWRRMSQSRLPSRRAKYRRICREYEERANHYGYSLSDLGHSDCFPT